MVVSFYSNQSVGELISAKTVPTSVAWWIGYKAGKTNLKFKTFMDSKCSLQFYKPGEIKKFILINSLPNCNTLILWMKPM